MSESKVISFGKSAVLSHTSGIKPNANEGEPFENCWVYYHHDSGNFRSGIWDCTAGSWSHEHPKTEFCYVLEGSLKIIEEDGPTHEFHAGDSFIVPKGTSVTWVVDKYAKKLFVGATNLSSYI